MNIKTLPSLAAGASFLVMASVSQAVIIDFTGGAFGGNSTHYEENGFQVDVIGGPDAFFGDYYGVGNDVIHAHWIVGITEIKVTKIGGGTFDLNYFILTSNTHNGGGPASGTELTYIKNNNGNDQLLPSEDWGFPATQIFLGAAYDGITSFSFYTANNVFCFGMDEFYIDEAAPSPVPDGGSTIAMMVIAVMGLVEFKKRIRS